LFAARIVFLLLFFAAPALLAQERNSCGGLHRRGDRITCYVTFAAAADLTHVEVVFNFEDGKGGNLVLRESRRVGAKTYEVSGRVSDSRPGNYRLAAVTAARGSAYRLYQAGFGLSSEITLEVENVSVKPEPRVPSRFREQGFATGSIANPAKAGPLEPHAFPEVEIVNSSHSPANAFAAMTRPLERLVQKNRCGGKHRPGERLSCRLQFDNAVELSALSILLDMDDRDRTLPYNRRPEDQRGLCSSFVFEQHRKINARTYEVGGTLPACGSGRYFLSEITAFSACNGDAYCRSRRYSAPTDIRKPATFRVENSHQAVFPGLSGVSATLGREIQ
jgi:hypothetical protein